MTICVNFVLAKQKNNICMRYIRINYVQVDLNDQSTNYPVTPNCKVWDLSPTSAIWGVDVGFI